MDLLYIIIPIITIILIFLINFCRGKNLPPTIFPALPIIGHLYLLFLERQPLQRTLNKLSTKYGPILLLRFGYRNVVVVADPLITEECFTKDNDVIFANRPKLTFATILAYNSTNTAWAPYGPYWLNLRGIERTEFFSSLRLQDFYDVRAEEGKAMLRSINVPEDTSSKEVDLSSVFADFITNVIIMWTAGKRFSGEDAAKAKELQEIVKTTFQLGATNLGDYLPFLKWLGFTKDLEDRMRALVDLRDTFFRNLQEEFKQGTGVLVDKNITMLGVMLKLQAKDPEYWPDEIISAVLLNLISSCIDDCSATMIWALALLLNNPSALKKAQEEIDTVVGTERFLEESDLSNLPYLGCVVKETMRLYPIVPTLQPHESSEDCVVQGYNIPKGTVLIVNQWGIHHDPNLWSDPESFKPERFEGTESTTPKLKFMPFSSGLRMCAGYALAVPVVGLAIGLVIQSFDWERISEDLVDMTENGGLVLIKDRPLIAKCTPRPIMQNLD
uniref:cytochrome P450 81Q32-like n=1 Tax=Erigeron canadensis TaxID=72917 RepID=UPI001CB95557|nr:cytochrome P450 81Q32-like [Erigeron canadensis]